MLKLLTKSFDLTLQNRILLLLTYAVNLFFGLIITVFFYKILITEAGGSIVLNELISDFNYMVFSDFMQVHGSAFTPVFLSALAFGVVYYLVNTFMAGGIFHQYKCGSTKFQFNGFWKSGLSFFGKYLLLAIIVFLMRVFILAFSGILFFLSANIAEGGSEREYILWMIPPLIILIFTLSIVTVIRDYTQYILFENKRLSIVSGLGKGVSYVFKNFRTLGFYWFILGAGILIGLTYLLLDSLIGMHGSFTILLMAIVQQIVVFARAFIRNWNYALVHTFYVNSIIVFNEINPLAFTIDDNEKPSEVD